MNNELNEQYFKTRKEHASSYNKQGYLIWIVLGIGVVSFFVVRAFLNSKEIERKKADVLKSWIETGTLSSLDTLISSRSSGTQVLVLNNCTYKEFENTFAVFRNDASGLTYLTKRIISNADYPSSLNQWRLLGDNSVEYIYSNLSLDSINGVQVETAAFTFETSDKNQTGEGRVRLVRKGGLIYALQMMAIANNWKEVQTDVARIENSFQIVE
jgi:hypothetical protein